MFQELTYALRRLAKTPVVTLVAVFSLALGIGANTTIFTLVNAVLLNPLPVDEPGRLAALYTLDERFADGPRGAHHPTSYPNFEDLRDHNEVFTHLVAYQITPLALMIGEEPEEVMGQAVSSGFFDMLGIQPAAGRFFAAEENGEAQARPVAVLSHTLWEKRFGSDPQVVGRNVRINGQPFDIIGVAPAGFTGANLTYTPDLWVPMMLHDQLFTGPMKLYFQERRALMFWVMGRLKDGVTIRQAEQRLQSQATVLAEEYPTANGGRSVNVLPLAQANIRPDQRKTFALAGRVMLLVVGLVLVIACANVAHLLLIRAERRRTEISLRLALGSSRWALIRQFLMEGMVLAFLGGGLGLLLAYGGRQVLWNLRPPFLANAHPDLSFDIYVLGFTLVVSILTALVAGLLPAFRASQVQLSSVLRDTRQIFGSNRLLSLRSLMIVFQIALSLVALITSGLFLNSLREFRNVDTGFAAEKLGVLAFNLDLLDYDPDRGLQFQRRLIEEVESLPEVRSASLATNRPLNLLFNGFLRTVFLEGEDLTDPQSGRLITTNVVSDHYFETFDLPILQGRGFTSADREAGLQVAVINQTMAQSLWPGEDPLSKRFFLRGQPQPYQVTGIARDSKYESVGEEARPYIYLPLEQNYTGSTHLFVHTDGRPDVVMKTVQRTIGTLDRALPVSHSTTMAQEVASSLWAPRLSAYLMGAFGFLALVMAAIGCYGILSFTVSLRAREMAIRIALGAEKSTVLGLTLRHGMTLVAIGILVGWIASASLSRLIDSLLFGVSGTDPMTFVATAVVMLAVAFLANLIPALRATTVEPQGVLRGE